jgi:hypothetical protein
MSITCLDHCTGEGVIKTSPPRRPGQQLRMETETMLRDMAYVLRLTHQVKKQILHEQEESATVISARPE